MLRILIALLSFLLTGLAHADNRVVICYASWPPAKIVPASQEDKRRGFVLDMFRDMYERRGFRVEFRTMPYARAVRSVEEGHCDIEPAMNPLIGGTGIFPDMPSYVSTYAFFVRKGSGFRYTGIESLRGLTLGVLVGYDYSSMDPSFQQYINTEETGVSKMSGTAGVPRLFVQLGLGRIDLLCEDLAIGSYIAASMPDFEFEIAGRLERTLPLYPMFNPHNPEKSSRLIKIFEDEMRRSPSLLHAYIARYNLSVASRENVYQYELVKP